MAYVILNYNTTSLQPRQILPLHEAYKAKLMPLNDSVTNCVSIHLCAKPARIVSMENLIKLAQEVCFFFVEKDFMRNVDCGN